MRSSFPSPESVPVHVTGMLVVPENVHTGSPPFLKCGLVASAAEAVMPTASSTIRAMNVRRMYVPPENVVA